MTNDRQIKIAVGSNRKSISWQTVTTSVGALYGQFSTPIWGAETLRAYSRLKKSQQDDLKDVGGFVGGALNGFRRKAANVIGRDLITLDFDNIPQLGTDRVISQVDKLGCSYCIYSTRKHTPERPRLRIIIPTDRTMTPDEYEPCARRVAQHIGLNMADPTTFEVSRLMYYPSCCCDSEYVYRTNDAPLISVESLLGTYTNWHDVSSWPVVEGSDPIRKLAAKQGDPLEKSGVIGAFCKVYDIYRAIEELIPGVYTSTDTGDDRYTYTGGSTSGGAIIYDGGKFLFSHHATDPCSEKLVNAFDLVRLHKFGELDNDAAPDTPVVKLPSYMAMSDYAMQSPEVKVMLNNERRAAGQREFKGLTANQNSSDDWSSKLEYAQSGTLAKSGTNFALIFANDPNLRGRIKMNTFSHQIEAEGPMPWGSRAKVEGTFTWTDSDLSGLKNYIDRSYKGLRAGEVFSDAFNERVDINSYNPVRDYLNGLTWDGVPRLDTLFIDYLGAEDTPYNRTVCRKAFCAAVARAVIPCIKFDNMLILSGPQGIGKSTLLGKMGGSWFNDSIRTFEGKTASELLQGVWIVEIAELDAFQRSEVSTIKQFLSIREDRYRAAYGRYSQTYPRTCVIFGTTNTTEFLKDTTGNRRFWPVDVGEQRCTKSVFRELDAERDQLWAEAKARWEAGEELHLTGEIVEAARLKQEEHMTENVLEGVVREFLEKPIPADWYKIENGVPTWPIQRRIDYWHGCAAGADKLSLVPRDKVCVAEIWCEALNRNIAAISDNARNSRNLGGILRHLGWTPKKCVSRFGEYNLQKAFLPPSNVNHSG